MFIAQTCSQTWFNDEAMPHRTQVDRVQAIGGSPGKGITWYSIKVLQGSNPKVNGKEGVVNAKSLTCDWYDFDGKFIRRD